MLILAGLGNPGAKYAGNRHNLGFMAVDAIADRFDFQGERARFLGLTRQGVIPTSDGPVNVLMLKPQTFMNESGKSVAQAMHFFKAGPGDVVAFHDELDLAPGRFRMKTGGGTAGHNGLRSVGQWIGADELPWVKALCDACAQAAPLMAAGQDERYQAEVLRLAPAEKADPRQGARDDAR